MRKIWIIICCCVLVCGSAFSQTPQAAASKAKPRTGGIDSVFRSFGVRGGYLLFDNSEKKYTIYSDAHCKKRIPPGETFEVPLTLMAIESGLIKDSNFVFKTDSIFKGLTGSDSVLCHPKINISQALKFECNNCFKAIARTLGQERLYSWLHKFNYGSAVEDSTVPTSLDEFWSDGNLRVSMYDQIEFLRKMYFNSINAKKASCDLLKTMLLTEQHGFYQIYGKLGTVRTDKFYATYSGYIEKGKDVYFFALCFEKRLPQDDDLIKERLQLNQEILKYLHIVAD